MPLPGATGQPVPAHVYTAHKHTSIHRPNLTFQNLQFEGISSRCPCPLTVTMWRGLRGSGSIFSVSLAHSALYTFSNSTSASGATSRTFA